MLEQYLVRDNNISKSVAKSVQLSKQLNYSNNLKTLNSKKRNIDLLEKVLGT